MNPNIQHLDPIIHYINRVATLCSFILDLDYTSFIMTPLQKVET